MLLGNADQERPGLEYDVFISHASEDKDDVARPLTAHLRALGLSVWLDELELTLGDSLRRNIDRGLSESRFGVVILSPAFIAKEWPGKELDGLFAREDGRTKVVLPIWHRVSKDDVTRFSPMLADKVAVSTERGMEHVAKQVAAAVRAATHEGGPVEFMPGPSEEEVLGRLRTKLITAKSASDMHRAMYELEEYMANYPHSVEARMLHDSFKRGIDAHERELSATPGHFEALRSELPKSLEFVRHLVVIVLLGAIAVAIYLLVKWIL
jgi:hypothetical protein